MKVIKLLLFTLMCGIFGPFNISLTAAATQQRPISDFVSQQGTFCLPDGSGGCLLFVPPVANFLGWGDSTKGYGASIDYAGIANRYLIRQSGGKVDVGTQTTGTVIERALLNGQANVSVILQTRNALSWAVPTFDFTGPPIFGVKVNDVLRGATPALANVEFRIEFINSKPGAPLPDLIQLFFAPTNDMAVVSYSFQASATGLFCDGSKGSMNVSQTGNAKRSNVQAAIVNLHGTKPRCP